MALVPHQGLGSRTQRVRQFLKLGAAVRAPGSRTAAPNFKNCRTVETMYESEQWICMEYSVHSSQSGLLSTSHLLSAANG